MMTDLSFDDLIQLALSQEFTGWDWSWFNARTTVDPLPWDYEDHARRLIARSQAVLDIDTGGGEILARLGPFPLITWATEGHAPNLILARERLEPIGIQVADVSEIGGLLPFVDNTFDLVIDRHGGLYAEELYRVMQPGGRFLTQQVGGENSLELNQALQQETTFKYSYATLNHTIRTLVDAGLQVTEAREAFPSRVIQDIAAVVFYLRNIPWQIEDFSVDAYRPALFQLHETIRQSGGFAVHEHRILIEAIKPFE